MDLPYVSVFIIICYVNIKYTVTTDVGGYNCVYFALSSWYLPGGIWEKPQIN